MLQRRYIGYQLYTASEQRDERSRKKTMGNAKIFSKIVLINGCGEIINCRVEC